MILPFLPLFKEVFIPIQDIRENIGHVFGFLKVFNELDQFFEDLVEHDCLKNEVFAIDYIVA